MASSRDPGIPAQQPADRRMRQRRPQRVDGRMERDDSPRARRRQRTVIIIGVVALVLIGAIAGFGYYREFVAPNNVLAARVGDTRYSQGDVVKRIRMLQAESLALGQQYAVGTAPFRVLPQMVEAGIIRRAAPSFNIFVTDGDIEDRLRSNFGPRVSAGEESVPGQLEREFKENYIRFLNRSHLSDTDYRNIVEESIYREKMREKRGERVPTVSEQVEVHWIALPSPVNASASAPQVDPAKVIERLEMEEFAVVAKEIGGGRYADNAGYVGWVPKGAFPLLDYLFFGEGDVEPLEHGVLSDAVHTEGGTYILKVTDHTDQLEISEIMREKLKDESLDRWLSEQKLVGPQEGWLEWKNDSEIYAWVLEQVRQSTPKVTPPAPAGG